MIEELLAVVREQDHRRRMREVEPLERREEPREVAVRVPDATVVERDDAIAVRRIECARTARRRTVETALRAQQRTARTPRSPAPS